MKRVLFIFAILGLTTVVAFGQVRENRPVSGFTGITASGAFNITVQRGSSESLVIETDAVVMPHVRSEVRDGVLYLHLDRDFRNRNVDVLNVTIVMQNFEQATLSGASNLTANDLFTPNRFRLASSGASNITINLNTGNLEIQGSGASNININANVSEYTRLAIAGASNIRGSLTTEQANFTLSGAADVVINGSASNANIGIGGASNVNLVGFPIRVASVTVSGASDLTINATDTLTIGVGGMSNVRYTGSATVQRTVNRTANMRRL